MMSFESDVLMNLRHNHECATSIDRLEGYRIRKATLEQQEPRVLQALYDNALVESTVSSNRIEGITAPLERIMAIVADNAAPETRPEQEVAGYRDVLIGIHESHQEMPFTAGVVLQLHRDLFRYVGGGDKWKPVDNSITERQPDGTRHMRFSTVPAFQTPEYMNTLHDRFKRLWNQEEVNRLLLIPAYVLDFLCIHPFLDGNGRMSRLITLLLLYKAGYCFGRYISLEALIEFTEDDYYEALRASSGGWHEGKHDLVPWTEYLLGILVAGAFNRRTVHDSAGCPGSSL